MAITQTALTTELIGVGIQLVQDIRVASNGALSDECCATIAAGILARETHGLALYETVGDTVPGRVRRL